MLPSFCASGATPSIAALHDGAQHDFDVFDVGEFVVGGDCVLCVALGVFDYEFEFATIYAACGIDLVGCHLLGIVCDGSVGFAETR